MTTRDTPILCQSHTCPKRRCCKQLLYVAPHELCEKFHRIAPLKSVPQPHTEGCNPQATWRCPKMGQTIGFPLQQFWRIAVWRNPSRLLSKGRSNIWQLPLNSSAVSTRIVFLVEKAFSMVKALVATVCYIYDKKQKERTVILLVDYNSYGASK